MHVRIFGSLRQFVGAKAVEIELAPGASVQCLLNRLSAEYPVLEEEFFDEDGSLRRSINVLLNGRHIAFLEGLDTTLQEDDQVALFPAVGGG
jgi:molybdopterin synthase sulfur carrier subunit